jgi:hypothetical protein
MVLAANAFAAEFSDDLPALKVITWEALDCQCGYSGINGFPLTANASRNPPFIPFLLAQIPA